MPPRSGRNKGSARYASSRRDSTSKRPSSSQRAARLEPADEFEVQKALLDAAQASLPPAQKAAIEEQVEQTRALMDAGATPSQIQATRWFHSLMQAGIVPLPEGAATALGIPSEKLIIRRALSVLSMGNAGVLASVLGVRLSTLYAYGDPSRSNRPGPRALARAAYAFRLLARYAEDVALVLSETAKHARPVRRGRPRKSAQRTRK